MPFIPPCGMILKFTPNNCTTLSACLLEHPVFSMLKSFVEFTEGEKEAQEHKGFSFFTTPFGMCGQDIFQVLVWLSMQRHHGGPPSDKKPLSIKTLLNKFGSLRSYLILSMLYVYYMPNVATNIMSFSIMFCVAYDQCHVLCCLLCAVGLYDCVVVCVPHLIYNRSGINACKLVHAPLWCEAGSKVPESITSQLRQWLLQDLRAGSIKPSRKHLHIDGEEVEEYCFWLILQDSRLMLRLD